MIVARATGQAYGGWGVLRGRIGGGTYGQFRGSSQYFIEHLDQERDE